MDPVLFVRGNTAIASPPLVPELRLHLATEVTPIWQATKKSLAGSALPRACEFYAVNAGTSLLISERFSSDFTAVMTDSVFALGHLANSAHPRNLSDTSS